MLKKRVFWLVALVIGLGAVGWMALPILTNALPSDIRQRLPHEFLALLQTPLPTALPAPEGVDATAATPIQINIPVLPTATAASTLLLANTSAAMVTAVSTNTPTPTLTPTPFPPLPTAFHIQGISNIPQKFNNCGPANLSVTLAFHGYEAAQLDIAASLKPNNDDRNVSPHELVAYVNKQTPLHAAVYSGGSLDLLKRFIAAGFPVIVEKGLLPNEWEGWMGHYLTIYGYDDAAQEFTSMDTYLGPWDGGVHTDSYAEMAEDWSHFNYVFVIVYPAERETAVHTLLGPQLTNPLTMWQQAARTAQSEINAQSDNAFAWFNLGTSLTHLGQLTGESEFYVNAAAAFDQARIIGLPRRMLWYQFEMYEAYLENGRYQDVLTLINATEISEGGRNVEETYLYQGYALLAAGKPTEAAAAFQHALELNPNFTPAQKALDN